MTRLGVPLFLMLAYSSTVFGQSAHLDRGWIDVNVGIAMAPDDKLVVTAQRTISQEMGTFRTTYSFPRGADVDFGGGVMFTPVIGAGVSVTGTAHQDTADLFVRIPHPLRFNAFGEDTAPTDTKLQRTEGTIHLQGMVVIPTGNSRVRIRVFGGPSYFRLKMDAVGSIAYSQQYQILGPGNVVAITNYTKVNVEHTAWGFHAGGDVSVFFTRVVGVGAVARFSRGTATVDDLDVLRDDDIDITLGGFHAAGGLRLKF